MTSPNFPQNYPDNLVCTRKLITTPGQRIQMVRLNGCNYTINGTNGIITSPNYPQTYPNSVDCTRKINTTPGPRIRLKFKISRGTSGKVLENPL